jgi:hypothetical protein
MTAPIAIEARQTKVFELIGQGHTHAAICKKLRISQDTLSRDLDAISTQVAAMLESRRDALITKALANYRQVVAHAWDEYRADARREAEWWAGKLDYTAEDTSTKTLATEGEDEETGLPAIMDESGAIEVSRKQRRVRPGFTSTRVQWLKLIIEATQRICELTGLSKLIIEHGGVIGHTHEHTLQIDEIRGLSSDELRRLAARSAGGAGEPGASPPPPA